MSQQATDEVAALKARIADLEARLAEADEYRRAWEFYDKEGILPPRSCELEEARRSGVTSDDLLAEMESVFREKRREGAA